MLFHTTLGYLSFLYVTTLNYNHQRNKEKTVVSFFAHLLKTPNRHADDFGVFHATQTQKSQHKLAFKTKKQMSL
jgi:hypothetical protein